MVWRLWGTRRIRPRQHCVGHHRFLRSWLVVIASKSVCVADAWTTSPGKDSMLYHDSCGELRNEAFLP